MTIKDQIDKLYQKKGDLRRSIAPQIEQILSTIRPALYEIDMEISLLQNSCTHKFKSFDDYYECYICGYVE